MQQLIGLFLTKGVQVLLASYLIYYLLLGSINKTSKFRSFVLFCCHTVLPMNRGWSETQM